MTTDATLNVALVTETFPPEVNGVAMTLRRLVDGLVRRGHRVQVVRPRQHRGDRGTVVGGEESGPEPPEGPGLSGAGWRGGGLTEVTVAGVPLPRYRGLHMGLPCKSRLVRLWREQRPDVVHIATEGPLGWSAVRACRKLGLAMSSSFHTNFHTYGKHYGYGFLHRVVAGWLRGVHNATAVTLVPSGDVKRELEADGFERVVVMGRGIDCGLFSPGKRRAALRSSWGVGPEDLAAVYVGRVAAEKNIPVVVRAFEEMRKVVESGGGGGCGEGGDGGPAGPGPGVPGGRGGDAGRARLVLVGDGPALAGLRKAHPEYVYAGMKKGEELAAHYASGDVFLFASVTETFGNVVTEAMASGLAVLSYDYAAGREHIVSGENGVLASFDEVGAYLSAARELAAEGPGEWKRLGVAARATAEGLTWERIVDQFEGVLSGVARGAGAGAG